MAKVYVKIMTINNVNVVTDVITDINSDVFIDPTGWVFIDEGEGEKYVRAQIEYLDHGVYDDQRRLNYKLVDTKPVLLTEEEKEALFPPQVQPPNIDQRLANMEDAINALLMML
jgi:hypothetical protein